MHLTVGDLFFCSLPLRFALMTKSNVRLTGEDLQVDVTLGLACRVGGCALILPRHVAIQVIQLEHACDLI